jgi:catechol 2,3-dioxygenase-like lactoylglutathione lyase family enzyme
MLQRPSHQGLRHVALGVRRFDAMKRFYVDVLGFEVEWEPDADNVYLSSGTDNLALHRSPANSSAEAAVLDAQPRTHRDGARSCYFRDPDGNRVQIIHHPPISGKI